jgi:putative spermidine/putrescine transport system substrate-binding protein
MDDAAPGIEFFSELNAAGNLVPVIANNALVARGETPVRITWDYLALGGADEMAGNPPIEVVIPESGRLGGVYLQAISAYAPHPNAAKLWMEHLYSDEGQLMWLKGYCHPIREADLRARGVVPEELAAKLPDVSGAQFATPAQQDAAAALIAEQWDSIWADVITPQ